ncbi:MAG TPA: glycosyl hydrolase [Puia sp.]|nr:glycosyl hydrolase [Puia sp.]
MVAPKHVCSIILWLAIAAGANAQNPVDPNATAETRNLYRYLKKLPSKGFLFGHQDDLAYGVGWKYIQGKSDIKDVTGDYPALYGFELGRIEIDHPVNLDSVPFDKMKGFIREAYDRGGIITISWHLNNPLTGNTAWQPAPGTVASILPGGEKHSLYTSWLDKIAAFFLSLKGSQGEYIPVIFRPFHELNGDWFWWGGKNCTPDEIKQLYRFTETYLRDQKKVHNLLYAFNTDRFKSLQGYLERYPGDEWVDITGFDIYQGYGIKKNEAFMQELDTTLTMIESIAREKNKIPALTEFGYNGLPDSTWWTNVLLRVLEKHGIAYALAWRNAGYRNEKQYEFYVPYANQASAENFIEFYRSPRTLFQKDIKREEVYH